MSNFPTADLDAAITAVCPIVGVSVGDPNDKTTWIVHYAQEATSDQQTAAAAALTAFVWSPAAADLRDQLDALNLARSTANFPWDFGTTDGIDDADGHQVSGVRSLQIRGLQDQANWTAAMCAAQLAIMNSQPAAIQPIKCDDNIWVQTTAVQVVAVLAALLARQMACLVRYGQLKKAIADAGADADALAAIDITTGWDG